MYTDVTMHNSKLTQNLIFNHENVSFVINDGNIYEYHSNYKI